MPSYKNIVTHTFKVCKCLKIIKLKAETPCIRKIYEYIHMFKEKSNFVADFCLFKRPLRDACLSMGENQAPLAPSRVPISIFKKTILNFQIFCKNCKTQKCLYLENCDPQENSAE